MMKKIPINLVIIIIWLFWSSCTFAQATSCTSNTNCAANQVCNFVKKNSTTLTTIATTGTCVAKCPETACPENKPVCNLRLGGVCTETCNKDYVCPTNMFCDDVSGTCIPSLESCSSSEDCPTDFVCDVIESDANHIYENKSFGYCTPKCTDANSCKYTPATPFRTIDKNVCAITSSTIEGVTTVNAVCAPNCNNSNYSCPVDSYCDTKAGTCIKSKVCATNTDCDAKMVCNLMSKNADNQGIVNRGGVCEPICPETACPSSRPICDMRLGGLCTPDCTQNSYKCPTYNDGTAALTCVTTGDDKGLCAATAKACKIDTDCATEELCDHVAIIKDHKFEQKIDGVCAPKCSENVPCAFTNNTPFRSPEKSKCNYEPGGLCEPDCSLKVYNCPNCRQCDKETGLCYGFTDDFIIVLLVKGTEVPNTLLGTQESLVRSRALSAVSLPVVGKIIVTSSNVSEYASDVDEDISDKKDINIFIVKQPTADEAELKKVEDAIKAIISSTTLPNSGKMILNDTMKLDK